MTHAQEVVESDLTEFFTRLRAAVKLGGWSIGQNSECVVSLLFGAEEGSYHISIGGQRFKIPGSAHTRMWEVLRHDGNFAFFRQLTKQYKSVPESWFNPPYDSKAILQHPGRGAMQTADLVITTNTEKVPLTFHVVKHRTGPSNVKIDFEKYLELAKGT